MGNLDRLKEYITEYKNLESGMIYRLMTGTKNKNKWRVVRSDQFVGDMMLMSGGNVDKPFAGERVIASYERRYRGILCDFGSKCPRRPNGT